MEDNHGKMRQKLREQLELAVIEHDDQQIENIRIKLVEFQKFDKLKEEMI